MSSILGSGYQSDHSVIAYTIIVYADSQYTIFFPNKEDRIVVLACD